MSKEYPMTYEEYKKRVIDLYIELYPKDKQEEGMKRLNGLLNSDHEFIEGFEEGYDHVLSDGGASLSQGQKQLICLARALVRNPSILILDEATSSIDAISEVKVQHAIAKLLEGRTSIIIAHRLSTIRDCDRILVLDSGKIIEDGNHKTLLHKNGKYAELYRSQFDLMSIDEQLKSLEE